MNKTLKRTFSLALCLVLALSLSACGKKTPLDRYNEASRQLSAAASVSAEYALDLTVSVDNVQLAIPAKGNLRLNTNGGAIDAVEFAGDLSFALMGVDVDCTLYLKDGVIYFPITVDGVTLEYKLPVPQDIPTVEHSDSEPGLAEDVLLSQNEENGVYTLVLTSGKLLDSAMQALDEESAAILGSDLDLSFSDMTITFTVDQNGSFKDFCISCRADMTIDGNRTSCAVKLDVDYTGFNHINKIDFPDFSSYQELELE